MFVSEFGKRPRQFPGLRSTGWRATTVVGAAALLAALPGCSSSTSTPPGASPPAGAAARSENLDPLHPLVDVETSAGTIRLKLDAERAPTTVRNFLNHVIAGYYANTLIHYVAPDKMILGGGYSVDGQPKPAGSTVRNEAHNGLNNVRGTVAMARDTTAGIDTATSQFFINLSDNPTFDHRGEEADEYGYCVFGEVVSGLDVADEISESTTQDKGGDLAQTPVPPVVIKSVRVIE